MTQSVACPYCNSLVLLPRIPEPDQRVRCPRCQELFAYHGQPGSEASAPVPSANDLAEGMLVAEHRQTPVHAERLSNRALARLVLVLMGLMAVVALIFAWSTKNLRRQHDQQGSGQAQVPVVAPAGLAGLRYIPSDADFVAGLHVGELWDKNDTQRILLGLRDREKTLNLGLGSFQIKDLENSLGVRMDDVDHVVAGINLLGFRLTSVVRMRRPFDERRVLKALNAERLARKDGKTVYQFPVTGKPLDGSLWFPDDQTLVFSFVIGSSPNLKGLLSAGDESVDRFAEPIRKVLTDKMGIDTQLWIVGHFEHWNKLQSMWLGPLPMLSLPAPEGLRENFQVLSDARTVAAWARFEQERATYHFEAGCKDAASARKLDELLERHGIKNGETPPFLRSTGPSDGRSILGTDVQRSLVRAQKAEWVTVDAASTIDSIARAIFGTRLGHASSE